jgi:hypothetical protein
MKPICPACDTPMVARYFVGYYEDFAFWQCKCEIIPNSTIKAGSFTYVKDGIPSEDFVGVEA